MMKDIFILFLLLTSASLISAQCGDADGSGTVDSADLVVMRNFLAENGGLAVAPARVDADGDGILDVCDLMLIQLMVSGITDQRDCPELAGSLYATDSIVGNLRFVPAGTFVQGSPPDEPCRSMLAENPETQFTHTLTRDLAVMETEVTQHMWAMLRQAQPALPANPSYSVGDDLPVNNLTWFQAVLFANLLSGAQGLIPCYYLDEAMTIVVNPTNYQDSWPWTKTFYCDFDADGYRLPLEGEWEYFCRAGAGTSFWLEEADFDANDCNGCTPGMLPHLENAEWYCANSGGQLHPAAGKLSNPWGLYDIAGNAQEWCWDWVGPYPSGSGLDYTGPQDGAYRVARGGGYATSSRSLRSANRGFNMPDGTWHQASFRLVRTVLNP